MKNKIEQMIASWVDENQEYLINELKDFLRIPSLTGHEGEAQKFVKA
jgi:acetylornithine deacetylase/succinyl-diaminopimelate desuccinylase-like protein